MVKEVEKIGIPIHLPNVQTSRSLFSVRNNKDIEYGLQAVKGVGGAAIDMMVENREKEGEFQSIYDFCRRLDSKSANKASKKSEFI